jgi:hypothetical protein
MKQTIKIIFFLFLFMSCALYCTKSSLDDKKSGNDLVIEVGDHEVTKGQFRMQLNEMFPDSNSINMKGNISDLLRLHIICGLVLKQAQECGFENHIEVDKLFRYYWKNTLIEAMREKELKGVKIEDDMLRECYCRGNEKLVINYVKISPENKNMIDEIVEYLKSGGEDFSNYKHIAEFSKLKLHGGSVEDKLEETAYSLKKSGAIKYIKYDNFYHIIQLISRIRAQQGPYKYEKEKIRKRLAKVLLKKRNIHLYNQLDKVDDIEIDHRLLSHKLSLLIEPLDHRINNKNVRENSALAEISGKTITSEELLSKLSGLPIDLHFYFKNNATRIKAVEWLLKRDVGYKTVSVKKSIQKKYNSDKSYPWIYPEIVFTHNDPIKLNYKLLLNLNIHESLTSKKNPIIARDGAWTLRYDDFVETWKELPVSVKKEMVRKRINHRSEYLNVQKELILKLRNSKTIKSDLKNLYTDNDLLLSVGLNINNQYLPDIPNDLEIVASLDTIKFTFKELIDKINSLPEFKRIAFDVSSKICRSRDTIDKHENISIREKAIHWLLNDEMWFQKALNRHLNTEKYVLDRFKKRKHWFLINKYMKQKTYNDEENILNCLQAHDEGNKDEWKLKNLLKEICVENELYLNFDFFNKWEIKNQIDSLQKILCVKKNDSTKLLCLLSQRGSILVEFWMGIEGISVTDLENHFLYPHFPTFINECSKFSVPDWAEYYGARLRGHLYTPESGNYSFWIMSDDCSELWLSTDENPENKMLIASVPYWTKQSEWFKYNNQQSQMIYLRCGQRYYIEALLKKDLYDNHLSVLWRTPSGHYEVIPGRFLSPAYFDL